jgi:hypothetical protein
MGRVAIFMLTTGLNQYKSDKIVVDNLNHKQIINDLIQSGKTPDVCEKVERDLVYWSSVEVMPKDICYSDFAVARKDLSICDNASNKEWCIGSAMIDMGKPYIKLISPNGGEILTTGETYTISWTTKDVENVIISLLQGSSRAYLISPRTGVSASLGKFDWKIDNTFYVGQSDLKIVLSDAAYCGYVDESTGIECVKDELPHGDASNDYFAVIKPSIEPYIKVRFPNGGETFKEGENINILWDSKGVDNIYIRAYYYDANNNIGDPGSGEEFSFNSGECRLTYEPVSAVNSMYYTVKNDRGGRCGQMPAGNRIKIEISTQGLDIKDTSDDYFIIEK